MFGAGSASDITARHLAEGMAKLLGAPVPVVEPDRRRRRGGLHARLAAEARRLFDRVELQLDLDHLPFRPAAVRLQELRARRPRHRREPGAGREGQLAVEDAEGAGRLRQGQPREGARRQLGRRAATPISPAWRCSPPAGAKIIAGARSAPARPPPICWATASRRSVQFPQAVVPHVKSGDLRVLAPAGHASPIRSSRT